MSTTNPSPTIPLSSATKIASHAISPNPALPPNAIELSQTTHRINLLNTPSWSPFFTSPTLTPLRILEIGCGQGTTTQVLASLHPPPQIDALDPAPLSYGAPYTLRQAQSHLSAGPLGKSITWHQASPVEFLSRTAADDTKWDIAVLAHCIWYFKSPAELSRILVSLKGRVKAVCIAEYALHATERGAVPHVLASLARATFEAHRQESEENIQNVLSPAGIRRIAEEAGWAVRGETSVVVPGRELSDGEWEVATVVGGEFLEEVGREIGEGRVRDVLVAARDAVVDAVGGVGGMEGVRTMDVWVGGFVEK